MKIILIILGILIYIVIGVLLAALSGSNNEVINDPDDILIVIFWPLVFAFLFVLLILLIIIDLVKRIFNIDSN